MSHSFLCWQDTHIGWVVLGANANGVTLDTWPNFSKGKTCYLWYPENGDLWTGVDVIRASLNKRYDYTALVGMGVVELAEFYGMHVKNPLDDGHRLFCSEFTSEVIRAAGYTLLAHQDPSTIDPADEMQELATISGWKQAPLPT